MRDIFFFRNLQTIWARALKKVHNPWCIQSPHLHGEAQRK